MGVSENLIHRKFSFRERLFSEGGRIEAAPVLRALGYRCGSRACGGAANTLPLCVLVYGSLDLGEGKPFVL
jgi:hypothetical protein